MKVKLNSDTVEQMLKGEGDFAGVARFLEDRAHAIAEQAGDGMAVESFVGATRARVTVSTDTWEAKAAEATDAVLTSALDAGRA